MDDASTNFGSDGVVHHSIRERQTTPKDRHRGSRAETRDRTLAVPRAWARAGRSHPETGVGKKNRNDSTRTKENRSPVVRVPRRTLVLPQCVRGADGDRTQAADSECWKWVPEAMC